MLLLLLRRPSRFSSALYSICLYIPCTILYVALPAPEALHFPPFPYSFYPLSNTHLLLSSFPLSPPPSPPSRLSLSLQPTLPPSSLSSHTTPSSYTTPPPNHPHPHPPPQRTNRTQTPRPPMAAPSDPAGNPRARTTHAPSTQHTHPMLCLGRGAALPVRTACARDSAPGRLSVRVHCILFRGILFRVRLGCGLLFGYGDVVVCLARGRNAFRYVYFVQGLKRRSRVQASKRSLTAWSRSAVESCPGVGGC